MHGPKYVEDGSGIVYRNIRKTKYLNIFGMFSILLFRNKTVWPYPF